MQLPLLTLIVFSPLAGAIILAMLPREPTVGLRRAAFVFSLVPLAFAGWMLERFQPGEADFQFVERARWIPQWGIEYRLGVDGVSLFLVLLTALLVPIVVLASWGDITRRVKEFLAFLLVLETGMLGAFLATDLFLFYVFWELMLVPMYFLIGVWGGARRVYAAVKFVLFTLVGSLLMLIAILYCAWRVQAESGSFAFGYDRFLAVPFTAREQLYLFTAFALAFAIKVPLFPLHTWLPDAHVEAPTGGSVILAGVLLKMGTYGFLRFAMPLFPTAAETLAPVVVALAVVGIVYGALVATVQPDLKKLVAYSSVSHLGFVMLGLFVFTETSAAGSVYQMLNHGLSTGALFLLVGMIYERRHTRLIADFGGLWSVIPVYASFFLVAMLASVGLPGLNGFIGEFLILLGAFGPRPWATAVATSGVVLAALYLLWMYQRVVFGPLTHLENAGLRDLSAREIAVLVPVLALCFVMGLYPAPFFRRMEPSINKMLARLRAPAVVAATPSAEAALHP
ncbi:MAG TPA: NADH-quinone oxidoreductase subunit M [Candidatus Binatus sp.]|jgi:NADH-quinone oxidoreductase subunit M|nr:NADH-quinone oxidoreductase subunit M [Candidatus Binatus sp.]